MERGKKNVARAIVYDAMDVLSKKSKWRSKKKRLKFFIKLLIKLVPAVEVSPRRVGGSVYQIPTEVEQDSGSCSSDALA